MESSERTAHRLPELMIARHVLPAILLVLSLVMTYHLWRDAKRTADHSLQTSFAFRVRELNELISQRVLSYQQLLLGTAGLFAASEEVTRDEFHAYVESLGLEERFPGIHGIGYAQYLPPAVKEAHEQAVRKSGFPDYAIWPAGRRDSYTSIVYLEPFTGRNLRAFGYDMYTDPVRRAAMAQARDSGKAVISGKVVLVQETDVDVQAGFLAYLPVYRNHMPHDSLSSRRANLLGWVYAPFRMNDLMRDIQNLHGNDLDIEIYDGETASAGALMYDSGGPDNAIRPHDGLRSAHVMEIGGHRWLVVATALPAFEGGVDYGRAALVLRGGIGISLLLALLVWVFLDDRARAIQAADQAYRLALYDTLTGLPNRKLVLERLAQALVKARRNHEHVALLFIDLDRFKPVNDEHGHAVGDLREARRTLPLLRKKSGRRWNTPSKSPAIPSKSQPASALPCIRTMPPSRMRWWRAPIMPCIRPRMADAMRYDLRPRRTKAQMISLPPAAGGIQRMAAAG